MNKIINLTQHTATPEQIKEAAHNLTMLAVNNGYKRAMIGGMPALMPVLQNALLNAGVTVLYARSERVSQDVVQPDGSVRKVSVFAHRGFYEVSA